jgi:hypothetical protein
MRLRVKSKMTSKIYYIEPADRNSSEQVALYDSEKGQEIRGYVYLSDTAMWEILD